MTILLFALATGVMAALLHFRMQSFLGASLLAATLAAIGLQVVAFIQAGHLQALAAIGFLTSWTLAIIIALLTGWIVRRQGK